jgi:PPM family protein phosphatase
VIGVVQSFGSTDTGRKRRRNEDAFVCEPPLFAVADGMGGAQAGEVASGLAAAALREGSGDGGGERRVTALIQEANRRVHDRATTDAAASGMGTTITVALVEPDGRVAFGHVGDSRAYLLRDGRLDQLTDDHSLVAELVRRGELSPAEAEVHPQRSVITRALGTDPDVDVDTFSVEARPEDVFLICSDGLSSYVDGGEIEQIMSRHRGNLEAGARSLIEAANRGGGEDNITAVLFAVGADGEPDERTREYATVPDAPQPDDEDTLHPEDNVALPPQALDGHPHAPVDDTMIVSAAALAEARESAAAAAAVAVEPEAGLGRRLLASFVIAALVALIVLLAWWGLAR